MGPPILLAPAIASVVFTVAAGGWQGTRLTAAGALLTAFLIGWPVLFWAYDTGRTSWRAFATIGALAGAAPFGAALFSGIAGQYILSTNLEYVSGVLERGAPMPYYGQLSWLRFGVLTGTGMISGALWGLGSLAAAHALDSITRPRAASR